MKKALAALCLLLPRGLAAAQFHSPTLWQERYFFDGLIAARDKAARTSSDPQMIPVMESIAGQFAQQALNLRKIKDYIQMQPQNLDFAWKQKNPQPGLNTINSNFQTLTKGNEQIDSNLNYLTVRCRIAYSQALPDPQMKQKSLIILAEIRQIQFNLNALYQGTVAIQSTLQNSRRSSDKEIKRSLELLMKSVLRIQDAVFSAYQAGYALARRCQ